MGHREKDILSPHIQKVDVENKKENNIQTHWFLYVLITYLMHVPVFYNKVVGIYEVEQKNMFQGDTRFILH